MQGLKDKEAKKKLKTRLPQVLTLFLRHDYAVLMITL